VSVESIKWGKNQKKYHTIRRNPKSTRQIVKTEACFIPLTYIYMTAEGPSWSHGSWIYNYLCNQCLSPLTLWVRIPLRRGVFGTSLCNKVCQWLTAGRWFSMGTSVSSTNKTNRHGITEILLKVALSTINQPTYLPTYLPTYDRWLSWLGAITSIKSDWVVSLSICLAYNTTNIIYNQHLYKMCYSSYAFLHA
jgi:hypothetical protein